MTLHDQIARVLDHQENPQIDNEVEWDTLIKPWKARMSLLYNKHKRTMDFTTSSRIARAEIVKEMLESEHQGVSRCPPAKETR